MNVPKCRYRPLRWNACKGRPAFAWGASAAGAHGPALPSHPPISDRRDKECGTSRVTSLPPRLPSHKRVRRKREGRKKNTVNLCWVVCGCCRPRPCHCAVPIPPPFDTAHDERSASQPREGAEEHDDTIRDKMRLATCVTAGLTLLD